MEKSNGFKIWGRGAVNPTGLTCGLNVENERFKKKKKARMSPRCLDLASGGK